MRRHLAECSSCRSVVHSLQQWDRQFTHAMNEVVVPAGLANRIASALEEAAPVSAEGLKHHSRRSSATRYRRGLALVTVCLVAVSLGWMSWVRQSGRLPQSSVPHLWEHVPEAMPPRSNLMMRLPHGWSSLQNIAVQDWMQVTISSPRLTVAVKPFQARFQRGGPVEGALYVLPKWRWSSSVVTSVLRAQVHYAADRVWVAWSEGDAVYLMTLNGSPELLERLQRQLDGGHVVF